MTDSLLEIEGLSVTYRSERAPVSALDDVSFAMARERLGIVGESGSGKSTLGRAILGLLPPTARIDAAAIRFDGMDLDRRSGRRGRGLRGRRIGLVPQHPAQSLNPLITVGGHLRELCRIHLGLRGAAADTLGRDLLEAVGLTETDRVWRAYPHEVSGGMAQRVAIALALLPEPDLVVADEATSALDAITRLEITALLDALAQARGMAVIMISHDLSLVRRWCNRVLVMQRGRIVDRRDCAALEDSPHPYTRQLLAARPRLERRADG